MFSFLQKKPQGQHITLNIKGMHCTSCAMNIDGALEETKGVYKAVTSYAKGKVTVLYDEKVLSIKQLQDCIAQAGYDSEVA